jgi:Domain of unknown function (DUF1906)
VEGVDFSGERPSPVCLYSMGKRFIARYFGPGGSWKHASATEVRAARAAGLSIVALAEGFADDALLGEAKGEAHAISASVAAGAVGMPPDRPIYFAVDFDMQPIQRRSVALYFRGVRNVIGDARTGIYGGINTVNWAADAGAATWFFQTYAWSAGKVSPHAHFLQYRNKQIVCSAEVDLCKSLKVDFGQWTHGAEKVPPSAPDTPPVVLTGSWDFTGTVGGITSDLRDLGDRITNNARALDALRR